MQLCVSYCVKTWHGLEFPNLPEPLFQDIEGRRQEICSQAMWVYLVISQPCNLEEHTGSVVTDYNRVYKELSLGH